MLGRSAVALGVSNGASAATIPTQCCCQFPIPLKIVSIVSVYDRPGAIHTARDRDRSRGRRNALRARVLKHVPIFPEIDHVLAAMFWRTQGVRGAREHHV